MRYKVEFDQGDIIDDSALNAIELKCYDKYGTQIGAASSTVGENGGKNVPSFFKIKIIYFRLGGYQKV